MLTLSPRGRGQGEGSIRSSFIDSYNSQKCIENLHDLLTLRREFFYLAEPSPERRMQQMLHNVVEMACAMNNTVYFNDLSPHNVENKIGFNDEYSVTECLELFMFRNTAEVRVCCKTADTLVKFFRKRSCSCRAVIGDPVIDGEKIVNSDWKITDSVFIRHGPAAGVSASSVYG